MSSDHTLVKFHKYLLKLKYREDIHIHFGTEEWTYRHVAPPLCSISDFKSLLNLSPDLISCAPDDILFDFESFSSLSSDLEIHNVLLKDLYKKRAVDTHTARHGCPNWQRGERDIRGRREYTLTGTPHLTSLSRSMFLKVKEKSQKVKKKNVLFFFQSFSFCQQIFSLDF